MRSAAICSGATSGRCPMTSCSCTRRAAALPCTGTKCSSQPARRCWWRSTREPARKCGPWMGDQRPGDNLFTSSTIALDVATGAMKGHFQYHPNDSWDWDEVSPPILVDYTRNGRTVKGLIDVARDGYMWFLERTGGPIKFVEGKPYVTQNVFKSLDP